MAQCSFRVCKVAENVTVTADTKDTLDHVIDAGWISKEEACAGVKAGSVKACD
jgi:D-xylose transport system substrate-binding protein